MNNFFLLCCPLLLVLTFEVCIFQPSPKINIILIAKVNQATGKKHFLIEVGDSGEMESTDADIGADNESDIGPDNGSDNGADKRSENGSDELKEEVDAASKSSGADYGNSPKKGFKSAQIPVRTFIHSHKCR